MKTDGVHRRTQPARVGEGQSQLVLKTGAVRREGSNPSSGTSHTTKEIPMTLEEAVLVSEARHGSVRGSARELWTRVLMGKHPDEGLEVLQTSGVLRTTLPEVQAMVGFGGQGQGHKDLWAHTKQVVK